MTSCLKFSLWYERFFLLLLALTLHSVVPVAERGDLQTVPIKMPGDISELVKDLLSGPKMNSSHTSLLWLFSSVALCNHVLSEAWKWKWIDGLTGCCVAPLRLCWAQKLCSPSFQSVYIVLLNFVHCWCYSLRVFPSSSSSLRCSDECVGVTISAPTWSIYYQRIETLLFIEAWTQPAVQSDVLLLCSNEFYRGKHSDLPTVEGSGWIPTTCRVRWKM